MRRLILSLGLCMVLLGALLVGGCTPEAASPTATPTPPVTSTPTPLPTFTPQPTPVPDVLYVDAEQALGEISPYVYGTNTGPWAYVPGELMPLAEEAGITYLRFPGGNYGDEHDLREPQIDQFIELCDQLGAEPSISVRMEGGTPEQAAEMVRYTNVEKAYGVRYWSIGNEPALYGDYDTERHNAEWRAIAEAMLEVDPGILLLGPEVTQYTGNPQTDPRDDAGREWVREFLLNNGDLVDVVAVHRYPFPTSMSGDSATIAELRANAPEWESIIANLRQLIRETTGRDLPVAITEANSHWNRALGGEATPDSLYNAVWWADVLGRLIRQDVEIVAHFALQSPPTMGSWGLLSRYEARPTYYVYNLYKRFGETRLHATSGDPEISIYAAQRADGAVTLMVVNLADGDKEIPLQWADDLLVTKPAEIRRLDAEHNAESLASETIGNGDLLSLPAHSVTLYVFPELKSACTTCGPGGR